MFARTLAIAGICTGLIATATAGVYDLADDWSDVNNPFGFWRLDKNIGQAFSTNVTDWLGDGSNQHAWADAPIPDFAHVPFWLKQTVAAFGDAQMGDIVMHGAETDRTGSSNTSAIFTVPTSGVAYVVGSVWMPRQIGRTMGWSLMKDGVALQSGELLGNGSTSRTNRVKFGFERMVAFNEQIELRLTSIPQNLGDLVGVTFHVETASLVQGSPMRLFADEGYYLFGEQSACNESDNDYYAILNDDSSLRATLGIAGYTHNQNPSQVQFIFEGSAVRYGLSMEVRLFNYDTNQYQVFFGGVAPTTDTTTIVQTSTNAGRLVSDEGLMRSQVSWQPINDEDPSQDGWLLLADYAHWNIS